MRTQEPLTLYHYTSGPRAFLILESGTIHLSPIGTPFVWLSSNGENELSAIQVRSRLVKGSLPANYDDIFRPMRFVVETKAAIPFKNMILPSAEKRMLVAKGRERGAKFWEWFGLPHAIETATCRLEGLHGQRWLATDRAQFREAFAGVRVGFVDGKLAVQGR